MILQLKFILARPNRPCAASAAAWLLLLSGSDAARAFTDISVIILPQKRLFFKPFLALFKGPGRTRGSLAQALVIPLHGGGVLRLSTGGLADDYRRKPPLVAQLQ